MYLTKDLNKNWYFIEKKKENFCWDFNYFLKFQPLNGAWHEGKPWKGMLAHSFYAKYLNSFLDFDSFAWLCFALLSFLFILRVSLLLCSVISVVYMKITWMSTCVASLFTIYSNRLSRCSIRLHVKPHDCLYTLYTFNVIKIRFYPCNKQYSSHAIWPRKEKASARLIADHKFLNAKKCTVSPQI